SDSFGLPPKTLQVRFGSPRAHTNHLECHCAVETLLPGAKYHALTAPADDFQQFVITQFSQCLRSARSFCTMFSSSRSIRFDILTRAAVIRFRPGYGGGGRVANGYGSVPVQTEAILK